MPVAMTELRDYPDAAIVATAAVILAWSCHDVDYHGHCFRDAADVCFDVAAALICHRRYSRAADTNCRRFFFFFFCFPHEAVISYRLLYCLSSPCQLARHNVIKVF